MTPEAFFPLITPWPWVSARGGSGACELHGGGGRGEFRGGGGGFGLGEELLE